MSETKVITAAEAPRVVVAQRRLVCAIVVGESQSPSGPMI